MNKTPLLIRLASPINKIWVCAEFMDIYFAAMNTKFNHYYGLKCDFCLLLSI